MEHGGLRVLTLNGLKHECVSLNELISIYSFQGINLLTKVDSSGLSHSSSLGRSKVIVCLRGRSARLTVLLRPENSLFGFRRTDMDPLADWFSNMETFALL